MGVAARMLDNMAWRGHLQRSGFALLGQVRLDWAWAFQRGMACSVHYLRSNKVEKIIIIIIFNMWTMCTLWFVVDEWCRINRNCKGRCMQVWVVVERKDRGFCSTGEFCIMQKNSQLTWLSGWSVLVIVFQAISEGVKARWVTSIRNLLQSQFDMYKGIAVLFYHTIQMPSILIRTWNTNPRGVDVLLT